MNLHPELAAFSKLIQAYDALIPRQLLKLPAEPWRVAWNPVGGGRPYVLWPVQADWPGVLLNSRGLLVSTSFLAQCLPGPELEEATAWLKGCLDTARKEADRILAEQAEDLRYLRRLAALQVLYHGTGLRERNPVLRAAVLALRFLAPQVQAANLDRRLEIQETWRADSVTISLLFHHPRPCFRIDRAKSHLLVDALALAWDVLGGYPRPIARVCRWLEEGKSRKTDESNRSVPESVE